VHVSVPRTSTRAAVTLRGHVFITTHCRSKIDWIYGEGSNRDHTLRRHTVYISPYFHSYGRHHRKWGRQTKSVYLRRHVRKTAKGDYELRCVFLFDRLSLWNRPPLTKGTLNFISEDFSKICGENSSFIKIWHEQRALYMKTCVHVTQLFLEWEIFLTRVVEKIKTRILCLMTFFRESCRLWDNVAIRGNTIRRRKDAMCSRVPRARVQTRPHNI
jgi:hypothetical protein